MIGAGIAYCVKEHATDWRIRNSNSGGDKRLFLLHNFPDRP